MDGLRQQIVPAAKCAGIDATGIARGAAPCSERSDAKQPGHSGVRAVRSAGRTYSRQESIEVRSLFQRDHITLHKTLPVNSMWLLSSPAQSKPLCAWPGRQISMDRIAGPYEGVSGSLV